MFQGPFNFSDVRPVPRIQEFPHCPLTNAQARCQSDVGPALFTHGRVKLKLRRHHQRYRNRDLSR